MTANSAPLIAVLHVSVDYTRIVLHVRLEFSLISKITYTQSDSPMTLPRLIYWGVRTAIHLKGLYEIKILVFSQKQWHLCPWPVSDNAFRPVH